MTSFLLLATADDEIGVVPAAEAAKLAQFAANELGTMVTARDPITDEMIAAYEPIVTYRFAEGTNSAGQPARVGG